MTAGEPWKLAQNATGSRASSGDWRWACASAARAAAEWPSALADGAGRVAPVLLSERGLVARPPEIAAEIEGYRPALAKPVLKRAMTSGTAWKVCQ